MKIKYYFPFLYLLLCVATPSVWAQKTKPCADYACVIGRVKEAITAKNYRFAFEQLESAKGYSNKNEGEMSELLKRLFNAVEKEKQGAINARIDTKNALDKLEATAKQAISIILPTIDRDIFRLDYDAAFEKCQVAINLEKPKEELKKRILEIAYFYTETDTLEAAIKTLNLLKINALPNRTDLLTVIQKNALPQYFTFLEERYYPKMITVEGGQFTMGSNRDNGEKPLHEVKLNSFKMAETETTVWQYFLYLKATRQEPDDTPLWQYEGNNPMVYVSWYDAVEYSNWVSKQKGKIEVYAIDKTIQDAVHNLSKYDVKWTITPNWQAKSYRLPTEAEWEFAARGGNKTHGFEFSGDSIIENIAWYDSNSSSRTQAVSRKKANELGLYDMSGNVWEWCYDWNDSYRNSIENNPTVAVKGTDRVIRGGSWDGDAVLCRVSFRGSYAPSYRHYVGFRLVLSLQ